MSKKLLSNKELQAKVKGSFMSQSLFKQWPDGLLVLDAKGYIFAINKKTEELLGYAPEELEGCLLHSILCGQAADYQHTKEKCQFLNIEQQLPINRIVDVWFIQKNGVYLHVDVKNVANLFAEELFDNDKSAKDIIGQSNYYVLSFQDCLTRRYSEKELQRLALFAELNPSPIIEFNEQALIYFSNPAMVQLIAELGFDQSGMPNALPKQINSLISQCLLNDKTINNIEVESQGRWFLWNFHPILERSLVQGYGVDITWRKESEELLFSEKERFLVTLDSIDDAVITVDTDESVTYMNPKATELTGWVNIEAIAHPFKQIVNLFNSDTRSPVSNIIQSTMIENRSYRQANPVFLAHRDGYVISVKQSASPMRNRANDVIGAVIALHDITDAQKMEQSLTYQATHDALTHLINRTEFENRLGQSIERSKTDKIIHSLLYMDLDNFKIINDSCDHTAGDQLLRQVTKLLEEKLRRGDILARLGGDEFAAILEGCPVEQASIIAKEICSDIQEYHFIWGEQNFNVGVSIGLVAIDEGCDDVGQLLSLVDSACYAAKDLGRNRVHVYQDDDANLLKKKGEMQWVSRINKALQENRFVLFFQLIKPIKCEESGLHFEILIRMRDEHGNLIPPGAFLPSAEHYDLIKILDHWVVRTTFEWLNNHPDTTEHIKLCSINLSGNSIGDEHFMHHLAEQFRNCRFSAEKICFEVTETAAISNLNVASIFINTIKELGCSFSLDDFGSGMSSFGYLKQLNIDYLKIDGLFVKDIVIDPVDAAMVKSINEVGQIMGLKTIAEYVENDEILAVIKEIGVDFAQGYGLSRPRPLDELAEVLNDPNYSN
ncbi:MAG: EAL domain-containing protein [gamma proteobacterium symbiont of Lucinoma myriamae]|nr:EAL domain-containing protein [gamma proteobacterium symbiont of Lucinoma myriamae]MCU7818800.1 EAL domain-containing protein [gamma proteobacterium symbiont of Lucinoma myriamae]MCU7832826.1 EAL domain-containing protein [gamma proteobacterium symbiont of Lucinoma myriamae]